MKNFVIVEQTKDWTFFDKMDGEGNSLTTKDIKKAYAFRDAELAGNMLRKMKDKENFAVQQVTVFGRTTILHG